MMLFMLLLMITIQHSAAAISRKTENDNLIGKRINLTANYSFITLLIPVFSSSRKTTRFFNRKFPSIDCKITSTSAQNLFQRDGREIQRHRTRRETGRFRSHWTLFFANPVKRSVTKILFVIIKSASKN